VKVYKDNLRSLLKGKGMGFLSSIGKKISKGFKKVGSSVAKVAKKAAPVVLPLAAGALAGWGISKLMSGKAAEPVAATGVPVAAAKVAKASSPSLLSKIGGYAKTAFSSLGSSQKETKAEPQTQRQVQQMQPQMMQQPQMPQMQMQQAMRPQMGYGYPQTGYGYPQPQRTMYPGMGFSSPNANPYASYGYPSYGRQSYGYGASGGYGSSYTPSYAGGGYGYTRPNYGYGYGAARSLYGYDKSSKADEEESIAYDKFELEIGDI
jgi:hypothetical protein